MIWNPCSFSSLKTNHFVRIHFQFFNRIIAEISYFWLQFERVNSINKFTEFYGFIFE